MADPIAPPAARGPAEALQLVSIAVSDGDLGAALAQYEHGAVLRPWADQAAWHGLTVQSMLVRLMQLRLPLALQVHEIVQAGRGGPGGSSPQGSAERQGPAGSSPPDPGEVGLVLGSRRIAGRGPGCERVDLRGDGATVVRRHRDGSWRIVVDAWRLDGSS
jgi:hypothetical protein